MSAEPLRPGARDAFSLDGRVALVTGGSSGIGAAVAEILATFGARIALTHKREPRSRDSINETVASVARAGGSEPFAVAVDVRSVDQARQAVDAVVDHFGRVDILVNSAGINVQQSALEVDEVTWDLIVDTNLKGLFFCCQAAARRMREQPRLDDDPYAIVNIASQMGFVGYFNRAAYCASKAGVVNLTRALAVEWAPEMIRVNAVAPGFVNTPLAAPMLANEEFAAEVIRRTPSGRIGEPEDVAWAVLYLCSKASRHVTGHSLLIDGGWTAW
jgi:NAD(P)-dependent dehydrogenase (short-subunit alcohol dehydrogenase family)